MRFLKISKIQPMIRNFNRNLGTIRKYSNSLDDVVVLDLETTGLSADNCRIIEIGAVRLFNNNPIASFSTLCNPSEKITPKITEITGISNQMVSEAPKTEDVMSLLNDFLADSPVIAHNKAFEERFLQAEMHRAGLSFKKNMLCTMLLSKRIIDSPNYKLITLFNKLNCNQPLKLQSHRALDDVYLTIKLWQHLLNEVAKIFGESKACDLCFLEYLMKKPTLHQMHKIK